MYIYMATPFLHSPFKKTAVTARAPSVLRFAFCFRFFTNPLGADFPQGGFYPPVSLRCTLTPLQGCLPRFFAPPSVSFGSAGQRLRPLRPLIPRASLWLVSRFAFCPRKQENVQAFPCLACGWFCAASL